MAKMHMKRWSISLIVKEMQINTVVRSHLTLVSMTIIKQSTNNKCWRGCEEMLLPCCWECRLVQSLWRMIWKFLEKLKPELPCHPAIPLMGISPEETITPKDICTLMFPAALFTVAGTWKQPRCPSTEHWVRKRCGIIYTMEYHP